MTDLDIPGISTGLARACDFRPHHNPRRPEALKYRGTVSAGGKNLALELELRDGELIKLPKVTLLDPPSELKFGAPHIESDGGVCYASPATHYVDRANALAGIVGCIEQARLVLGDVLEGRANSDPRNEFLAYWQGHRIYLDLKLGRGVITASRGALRLGGGMASIVGASDAALNCRFGNLVMHKSAQDISVGRLESGHDAVPALNPWPPTTIKQLVRWLKATQPDVVSQLAESFEKAFESKRKGLSVFVNTPSNVYGFGAALNKRSSFHSAKKFAAAMVGESTIASITEVERLHPDMISEDFIASRNLLPGQPSLLGRRIALVGCGAIGGYLAPSLMRIGAGMGGGKLTLIDPEKLGHGNLGRHYLGIPDLENLKAVALADRLKRDYPGVSVPVSKVDVESLNSLACDLLVNATGQESVTDWFSSRFKSDPSTPILHTWVEGNGVVAVAYLQDRANLACPRCFRAPEPGGPSRFLRTGYTVHQSTAGGCDGLFVPFSISAVLHAAGLATQLALGWVNRTPSPRLRLVYCEANEAQNIDDHDPEKRPDCPLCS